MKKLELRSETVKLLTDDRLDKIAGGTTTNVSCVCTIDCVPPTETPGACDVTQLHICYTRLME